MILVALPHLQNAHQPRAAHLIWPPPLSPTRHTLDTGNVNANVNVVLHTRPLPVNILQHARHRSARALAAMTPAWIWTKTTLAANIGPKIRLTHNIQSTVIAIAQPPTAADVADVVLRSRMEPKAQFQVDRRALPFPNQLARLLVAEEPRPLLLLLNLRCNPPRTRRSASLPRSVEGVRAVWFPRNVKCQLLPPVPLDLHLYPRLLRLSTPLSRSPSEITIARFLLPLCRAPLVQTTIAPSLDPMPRPVRVPLPVLLWLHRVERLMKTTMKVWLMH